MKSIRVLIADDHPVFRYGMRALLEAETDMLVLGEATSGEEVVHIAQELKPDLILMDLNMPGLNGIEATRRILADNPEIGILIVSMVEDETIFTALRVGARGYILKGSEGEETLNAIRTAAAGGSVFSPRVADRLIGYVSGSNSDKHHIFQDLTDREYEILGLMARGLTNNAIANRLYISPKTVRNYVSIIFRKMDVTNRSEAIVRAHQAGIGL